jgi:Spy/CpxP family protein refolding chaperone
MAFDSQRILIMKTFKLWLLVGLVFLAGVVAGVVGTRIVVRHAVRAAILHPEQVQTVLERNLTRKLRLDHGQQVKLHEILTDAHGQLKGLRREYRPQLVAIVSNANQQITAILTPEQQAWFEKLKRGNHPLGQAVRQSQ